MKYELDPKNVQVIIKSLIVASACLSKKQFLSTIEIIARKKEIQTVLDIFNSGIRLNGEGIILR